jgi:uncharacterized protein (DUF433 family)
MGAVHSMPPRGYYTAAEVGRLAGVTGIKIGQWARRGYIRSSQSDGQPRIYSFQDAAEAIVVRILIDRGATHAGVRAAIQDLRERYDSDWPLSTSDLASSGQAIVDVGHDPAADIAKQGQVMVYDADLLRVRNLLRRGGWAAETTGVTHIEIDPDRLGGKPVIKGRRVAAEDVAQLAAAPDGHEILRDGYDLSDEEIDDAVRWWRAVKENEAA